MRTGFGKNVLSARDAARCPAGFAVKGFTYMELLVVVFIISLLTAIVFPSLYSTGARKALTDARRTASIIAFLNDSAVSTKETHYLKFDLRDNTISWKGPDFEKSERFKNLLGVKLQSRGEVRSGEVTVLFGPLGARENITVYFRADGNQAAVEFNSISGRTKIAREG